MNFKTVAEAYGFYRNSTIGMMEARAQAIKADVASNKDADIAAYNIELEGISQAIEEKRGEQKGETEKRSNGITDLSRTASKPEGDGEGASSEVYRRAFYRYMQGHTLTTEERSVFEAVNAENREKRASTFNKLGDSAAVIPTTTLNEIVTKARDMGGILSISRGFNMPSNIAIPVATPGGAASWHTEGAQVDTEKANIASVNFDANEIIRIISISAAVKTMSVSAFESYLSDELTASVMACLGKTMIDGTGNGQGTGIISGITWSDANQVTVAKSSTLAYKDVAKAIGLLHRGYSNGASFVMNNKTLFNDVYGVTGDDGHPIFVADPTEAGKGRILGFPVQVDDFMADDDILFGNFNYNGYNLPEGIALEVSRDSSFKSGLVDYRALAVADCKPIVSEAFVRIVKATA